MPNNIRNSKPLSVLLLRITQCVSTLLHLKSLCVSISFQFRVGRLEFNALRGSWVACSCAPSSCSYGASSRSCRACSLSSCAGRPLRLLCSTHHHFGYPCDSGSGDASRPVCFDRSGNQGDPSDGSRLKKLNQSEALQWKRSTHRWLGWPIVSHTCIVRTMQKDPRSCY